MNTLMNTIADRVHVESVKYAERIDSLEISSEFQNDILHRSIFTGKDSLLRVLGHGGKVCLAVLDNKTIVGVAALDYPDPKDRWAGMAGNVVMELKAVEVIPEFRQRLIARQLISKLISDPELEQRILYLVSYTWIWDIAQTQLSVSAYRDVLVKLFSDFGFKEAMTNEPNVCLEEENVFMVRTGNQISPQQQEEFKWLRFGLDIS